MVFYRILSVSEWMWIPQNSALRALMKANGNNQMKCAYELWIRLNIGILCYAHFIQYIIHCLRGILQTTPPQPLLNYRETDRQTASLATCTPRWRNHWSTQLQAKRLGFKSRLGQAYFLVDLTPYTSQPWRKSLPTCRQAFLLSPPPSSPSLSKRRRSTGQTRFGNDEDGCWCNYSK